jgi:phosphate transport system permease protein
MTWICGGALAFNILLVIGLLTLLAVNGLGFFWQKDLRALELLDGSRQLGEVHQVETYFAEDDPGRSRPMRRQRYKVGNRDLTGADFLWVDDAQIVTENKPEDAVVLERLEWGNFYGYMKELREGDRVLARGSDAVWAAFEPLHAEKQTLHERIRKLERKEIGRVNFEIEKIRLAERRLELEESGAAEEEARRAELSRQRAELDAEFEQLSSRLFEMREELERETVLMVSEDGQEKEIAVGLIVRFLRPNSMGIAATSGLYASRLWEFLSADPRESNTEGGVFPAIFGTVMMVFLMSFAVVPFGVLAALYLREYAKEGFVVRAVRIAVNNLAGVPSIVFGVFGLGFFVYLVGGSIDRLFYPEALPTPTFGTGGILWGALTLALLTVPVVIVATEEGLAAVPRAVREGSRALGATKFETTWRVVVPAAAPGILTGTILAMARAAGEVAPLMIVGMVKLAPALPVDGYFPFVHFERKFMHLGFHIYDVGFQSPNVEATKPLVFATALLLIGVVTLMNLVAIAIRNHLRDKYAGSAV